MEPLSRALGLPVIAAIAVASPAIAQQAGAPGSFQRTQAPEPYAPAGELHFLGFGALDDGLFVDPASVQRDEGRAEAMTLTVQGKTWRTAEGQIRWTWDRREADCAARSWVRLSSDHYGPDGAWVGGFEGKAMDAVKAQLPIDETLLAYLCESKQPDGMQVAPSQAAAVAGIVDAFAGR